MSALVRLAVLGVCVYLFLQALAALASLQAL